MVNQHDIALPWALRHINDGIAIRRRRPVNLVSMKRFVSIGKTPLNIILQMIYDTLSVHKL